MALTTLQEQRTRTREARRQMAYMDQRYLAVGRYDAMLSRGQCPYPVGSVAAAEWREGFDAFLAERDEQRQRDGEALTEVISSMRSRLSK